MIINLRLCFFFWQGIVKTSGQCWQVNSNVKLCFLGGFYVYQMKGKKCRRGKNVETIISLLFYAFQLRYVIWFMIKEKYLLHPEDVTVALVVLPCAPIHL